MDRFEFLYKLNKICQVLQFENFEKLKKKIKFNASKNYIFKIHTNFDKNFRVARFT